MSSTAILNHKNQATLPKAKFCERAAEKVESPKIETANASTVSTARKTEQSLQEKALDNLVTDFGAGIQDHIMKLESQVDCTNFLGQHKVNADYRAKMIDWIVEVLTTFKCSDQAYFKTIQILDRYYAESPKALTQSSLHLAGVVAMFIATKYEDIIPLLMRTIVNKVGHNKFTKSEIQLKELEMLKVLKFNLGTPTVLEHLERLSFDLGVQDNKAVQTVFTYLAKLSTHNYELSQLSASELAGAIAYVGLKICDKKCAVKSDQALAQLNKSCALNIKAAKVNGRFLLTYAKGFEKAHPALKNLRTVYADDLKAI